MYYTVKCLLLLSLFLCKSFCQTPAGMQGFMVRSSVKSKSKMKALNRAVIRHCSNFLLERKLAVLPLPLLSLGHNRPRFYSTSSQFQLYDNYKDITSEVINKILINQQVFISPEELDKLKGIPGVKFDLPFNDETLRAFISLVGRSNSRVHRAGVYMFTHLT